MIQLIDKMFEISNTQNVDSDMKVFIDEIMDFDYIINNEKEKAYYIDKFPVLIKNFNKYSKLEICYDDVLDNKILLETYNRHENMLKSVLEKLWAISSLVIYTSLKYENIDLLKDIVDQSEKDILETFYDECKQSNERFILVDNYDVLNIVVKLSAREKIFSLLIFKDIKSIVWLNGLTAPVYLDDDFTTLIDKICLTEGVYLRKYLTS